MNIIEKYIEERPWGSIERFTNPRWLKKGLGFRVVSKE